MKKMMLMVGMLMMAVAIFAAGQLEWNATSAAEFLALAQAKNFTDARAYLEKYDFSKTDGLKYDYLRYSVDLDVWSGNVPTNIDAAKTQAAVYAAKVELKSVDVDNIVLVYLFYGNGGDMQKVYDYYKTLTNPGTFVSLYTLACVRLKKYDEAIALVIPNGDYAMAATIEYNRKDKVKCFEYSKKSLLGQKLSVSMVTELLERLWDLDFTDSAITPAMQLELLNSVNKKYSRFLVTDEASWKSIIAVLRTTIEEMKKDTK